MAGWKQTSQTWGNKVLRKKNCATIDPQWVHNTSTIHPQYIHDTSTIHPRYIHDTSTIHPRYIKNHGFLMFLHATIHPRYIHDTSTIHCILPFQIYQNSKRRFQKKSSCSFGLPTSLPPTTTPPTPHYCIIASHQILSAVPYAEFDDFFMPASHI